MDSKRRKTGDQDISSLRLASRQKYLAEREAQQLALLRRQVQEEAEEEERLGSKLSERERKEFAKNRKTLELAEARNAIDDRHDGYILPDADYSNKAEVLSRRDNDTKHFRTDYQQWEEDQMSKIRSQPKKAERVQEEDYEYIFDTSAQVTFDQDPSTRIDPSIQALQTQLDEAEKKAKTIEETQKSLPVFAYHDELLAAIEQHQTLVVVGETGSGKSTQIPQYVRAAGYCEKGMVAVTQPRRVAAMSVAKRVAEEAGCKLGNEVGYSIRFEDKTSPKTQIKFATDGILLQEAKQDPLLSNYSIVMIDEAHERSLGSDLLLVLCREVCHARPDFRLIILSATINAEKFSRYFMDCPVFNIPGRTYPVEILYTQSPEANYLSAAISTVWTAHVAAPLPGDILVFLTGEEEILAAMESIEETKKKLGNRVKELVVAPIYSALPPELQAKAFENVGPDQRKVILATNIAETSITFENVKMVIDSGYSKENVYVPALGLSSLVVSPISKANASQRAGRAGRTGPGKCFRLFTKFSYYNFLQARVLTRVRDVREQLVRLADRVEVPESSAGSDHVAIRKCLASAFFLNTARLQRDGQSYRTLSSSGLTVYMHPSSCLIEKRPKWCIFASLQATSKEWMMGVCPIESEWLVEVAPHIHTEASIGKLGDSKKMPKERGKIGSGRG